MFIRSYFIFLLLLGFTNQSNAEDWLGYSNIPAKMPMHIVFPRGDNETGPHARHKWAHPGMEYEIPLGIQGGAWPFKYELIEGPRGASVGSYHYDSNYGVVTWKPNSSSGKYDFKVRVTDQDLNAVDVEWTVKVDSSKFIFIQDEWGGEKVGTVESPLEDIADWYKGNKDDDTFVNKIVVFREGQYNLRGGDETNGNVQLRANSKTSSLIGFPNELITIDASKAKILTDKDELKDIFIANLSWENSRQDVDNAHFIWGRGDVSRAVFWRNNFSNHGPGRVGNDNPAGVFISSTGIEKRHILYKENVHDLFWNGGANGSFFDVYRASYVLIEANSATNSDNKYGFWAKATTSFVSIRANKIIGNNIRGGIFVGYRKLRDEIAHSHEVCWNLVVFASEDVKNITLMFAGSKSLSGVSYSSHIYRNTFVNGRPIIRFPGKEPYQVDGNVIVSNNLRFFDESIMNVEVQNITSSPSSGVVDSKGSLIGHSRVKHGGLVGHELINQRFVKLKPLILENKD